MTVPLRRGESGPLTPPLTSEIDNDSGVAGDTCSDALDNLAAAIPSITYGTPVATAAANSAGVATSLARSDHVHQTAGSTSVPNQSGVSGSTTTDALNTLNSGLTNFGTPVATAAANSAGVATTLARSDHVHQTAGSTSVPNQSGVSGSTTTDALNTLNSGLTNFAAPVTTGTANSAGAATTLARSDHVHQTGDTTAVPNVSSVAGATCTAALNALLTAVGLCLENVNIQVFTASGTYTPTAGMVKCLVVLTGPGGGGGGADTDGSASSVACGSGGGAGATQIKLFSAATIGASKAVVIGTGGGGGSTSGGNGSAGSANSTFGSTLLVAAFGAGGDGSGANVATAASSTAGTAGGAAGTEGDLNIAGSTGDEGFVASSATCTFGVSGAGGMSWWGTGGRGRRLSQASTTADNTLGGIGAPVTHYGAGGGGAIDLTAATGVAGGAGADGICVVLEWFT